MTSLNIILLEKKLSVSHIRGRISAELLHGGGGGEIKDDDKIYITNISSVVNIN
jgi:hypothetical protein